MYPLRKLKSLENPPFLKMYFVLNMGFCSAMLVYERVYFLGRCLKDTKNGGRNYQLFGTSCSTSRRWIIRSHIPTAHMDVAIGSQLNLTKTRTWALPKGGLNKRSADVPSPEFNGWKWSVRKCKSLISKDGIPIDRRRSWLKRRFDLMVGKHQFRFWIMWIWDHMRTELKGYLVAPLKEDSKNKSNTEICWRSWKTHKTFPNARFKDQFLEDRWRFDWQWGLVHRLLLLVVSIGVTFDFCWRFFGSNDLKCAGRWPVLWYQGYLSFPGIIQFLQNMGRR